MPKPVKYTADNPAPKPGQRRTADGEIIPDDYFANESDPAAILKSEKVSEAQIDKEEAAIDALLDDDDTMVDGLGDTCIGLVTPKVD